MDLNQVICEMADVVAQYPVDTPFDKLESKNLDAHIKVLTLGVDNLLLYVDSICGSLDLKKKVAELVVKVEWVFSEDRFNDSSPAIRRSIATLHEALSTLTTTIPELFPTGDTAMNYHDESLKLMNKIYHVSVATLVCGAIGCAYLIKRLFS